MAQSVVHFINLLETPTAAPFSGAENHLWVLLPALRAAGLRVELGVLLEGMGPQIETKLNELREHGIEPHCFQYRPRHWYCFPYHRHLDPRCLMAMRRYLVNDCSTLLLEAVQASG